MRFGAGFELVSIVKKLVAKPVLDNSTDDTITHHRAHRSVEAKRAVAAMASPSRRRGDALSRSRRPKKENDAAPILDGSNGVARYQVVRGLS